MEGDSGVSPDSSGMFSMDVDPQEGPSGIPGLGPVIEHEEASRSRSSSRSSTSSRLYNPSGYLSPSPGRSSSRSVSPESLTSSPRSTSRSWSPPPGSSSDDSSPFAAHREPDVRTVRMQEDLAQISTTTDAMDTNYEGGIEHQIRVLRWVSVKPCYFLNIALF